MSVASPETYRTVWVAKYVSVSLGVQKGFRGQNGMFFRRNPEFVVQRVIADFLCVVPIRDDTLLDIDAQYLYPDLGWRPP